MQLCMSEKKLKNVFYSEATGCSTGKKNSSIEIDQAVSLTEKKFDREKTIELSLI